MGAGHYTITGGRADADRLARQAHVMEEASLAFLRRAGLGPGVRCLDVGCGTGPVTIAMAREAAPAGSALGVDVDDEELAVAREAAAAAGVAAAFVHDDSADPPGEGAFDLAYARLVLSHLPDPERTVAAMVASVRPGGVVAVEDLDTDTLHADPPSAALLRLRDVYAATVRAAGADPTLGPKLEGMLAAAGLVAVEVETVVNRMDTVEAKLFLAQLVTNMRESIISADVATGAEVDELERDVEAAARDRGTVFHQTRMYQVLGRRP